MPNGVELCPKHRKWEKKLLMLLWGHIKDTMFSERQSSNKNWVNYSKNDDIKCSMGKAVNFSKSMENPDFYF